MYAEQWANIGLFVLTVVTTVIAFKACEYLDLNREEA